MALIRDKEIRGQISDTLKVCRKEFLEVSGVLTLRQLDQWCSLLGERRKEANVNTITYHQREVSIAYLSIWALAMTCIAIDSKGSRRSPALKNCSVKMV